MMKRTSLFLVFVTILTLAFTCGCGNIKDEKVTAKNVAEITQKVNQSDLSPADKDLFAQRVKYEFPDGSTVSFLINEQQELNKKLNTPLPQLPHKELSAYIKDLHLPKDLQAKVFRMSNLGYKLIGKTVKQIIDQHDAITKAFAGVQLTDDYKLSHKKFDALSQKHYKPYQSIYEGSIVNNSGRAIKEVNFWYTFGDGGKRRMLELKGRVIPNGQRWKFAVDVHTDTPAEQFTFLGITFVRFSDGTWWNLPRHLTDADKKVQPYNDKPMDPQIPPNVDSFSILKTGKTYQNK